MLNNKELVEQEVYTKIHGKFYYLENGNVSKRVVKTVFGEKAGE
ncbi:hypothetical protein ABLV92_06575 [Staphylococcus equorum]|nr:hypothetical protein [Staphylococcus equorum]